METWNGWSHTHIWWIKIGRDISGVRDCSPTPDHLAQGSSARKVTPHTDVKLLAAKTGRVGVAEETTGFSGVSS